ncbi:hypothetical protein FOL47_001141 [Perkinsus chesapeaki]|uniref:Integrase catalytic domain-containing protein n=1 Tax=Perkinsus chesapeaki TaxID=330153 RepID=A0A7J6KV51_PERCH|nr:hypothetical protein FOL47_001141 [Perkinsus chesapeaki]
MADKSKEEVTCHAKRRHMTTHDVDNLTNIRELLLRITVPVKVIHIPTEPHGPEEDCFKLLQSILDSPNERPTYKPTTRPSSPCQSSDDIPVTPQLRPLSPRGGSLPVPLPEEHCEQVPTLSNDEKENIDTLIKDSIKDDKTIYSYLSSGSVSPPFSKERLRRASTQYEINKNGQLYRIVLQRVVGENKALLLKLVGHIHIDHHHLGARQLMLKVKEKYHSKNLPIIVRRCVRLCHPCDRANAVRQYNSSAGTYNAKDISPLQVLGMDIYLPHIKDTYKTTKVTSEKDTYSGCLVVTCLATPFHRVHLLRGPITTRSEGLATLFNNSVWPSILVSDNASCFTSRDMLRWIKLHGMVHLSSPPYVAALSRWERAHREITSCPRSCACDSNFFNGKMWYEIIFDVVSNLNHLPYSEDCWITPAVLCFGFYDPAVFYKSNVSPENLTNKLVANDSTEAVEAQRQLAQEHHKLRMVDYSQHWTVHREKSRARVLTAHGRPCDLEQRGLVYHLVDSPKSKPSSRVLGPFVVSDIEAGKATAVVPGFNGATCRAWVTNLIRVPKDDMAGLASSPESPSTSSTADDPPVTDNAKDLNSPPSSHHIANGSAQSKLSGGPRSVSLKSYEWSLGKLPSLVVLPSSKAISRRHMRYPILLLAIHYQWYFVSYI